VCLVGLTENTKPHLTMRSGSFLVNLVFVSLVQFTSAFKNAGRLPEISSSFRIKLMFVVPISEHVRFLSVKN
jgi:hypothetical protein